MEIESLTYNWYATPENGEEFTRIISGKLGVVKIEEHKAQGEGDKWHYDVTFEDGTMLRIFNPNMVTYNKEVQK